MLGKVANRSGSDIMEVVSKKYGRVERLQGPILKTEKHFAKRGRLWASEQLHRRGKVNLGGGKKVPWLKCQTAAKKKKKKIWLTEPRDVRKNMQEKK